MPAQARTPKIPCRKSLRGVYIEAGQVFGGGGSNPDFQVRGQILGFQGRFWGFQGRFWGFQGRFWGFQGKFKRAGTGNLGVSGGECRAIGKFGGFRADFGGFPGGFSRYRGGFSRYRGGFSRYRAGFPRYRVGFPLGFWGSGWVEKLGDLKMYAPFAKAGCAAVDKKLRSGLRGITTCSWTTHLRLLRFL